MNDAVWIKGIRFREAREAGQLRLIDVAKGVMSPATLSRIERHERYRVPLSTVAALGRRMGLTLEEKVSPETWAPAVGRTGIEVMKRWRFSEALRVLRLRDVILVPVNPVVEVQAQILTEWAAAQCGQPERPDVMQRLTMRACEHGAVRQSIWASAIEARMHARRGDRTQALKMMVHVANEAEQLGDAEDVLTIRAAWARLLLGDRQLGRGLDVLQEVASRFESAPAYARARFLHARGLAFAALGLLDDAETTLRSSIRTALEIGNHRLAAIAERALASVYEQRGETERADATLVRAASLFTQAGDSHDAMEMISSALHHHVASFKLAMGGELHQHLAR